MVKQDLIKELLAELNVKDRVIMGLDYLYIMGSLDSNFRQLVYDKAEANSEELINRLTKLYEDKFEVEELQEALKFVKSKAGKEIMGLLIGDDSKIVDISSDWLKSIIEEASLEITQNRLKQEVEKGVSWRDYVPPLDINQQQRCKNGHEG